MKHAWAVLFLASAFLSCTNDTKSFSVILADADSFISTGAIKEAEEQIRTGIDVATGRNEWLSLIKRSYQVGEATGIFELMYVVSGRAFDVISGAEELAAVHVYACIQTGRIERAYQIAKERVSSPEWSAIAAEAALVRQGADLLTEDDGENSVLLKTVESGDPGLFLRASEIFTDDRFALDSALLFAARGNMASAYGAARGLGPEYNIPRLLISYDAEQFADAYQHMAALGEHNDIRFTLLMGDIQLKMDDGKKAALIYQDLIGKSPAYSWIPYANLGRIYLQDGDWTRAEAIIGQGKEIFPESRPLMLAEIEAALLTDRESYARNLVRRYEELFPFDIEAASLNVRLQPTEANLRRFETLLWKAFYEQPENRRIAGLLAGYGLLQRDTNSLERMLDIWENANGSTAWSLFYRGYLRLLSGDPEEAEGYFQKSWILKPRWQVAYNLAVIYGYQGDVENALEYLRLAENGLRDVSESANSQRARIRAQIAKVHYETGDFTAARREAQYAIDLDAAATGADLILRLLESRQE